MMRGLPRGRPVYVAIAALVTGAIALRLWQAGLPPRVMLLEGLLVLVGIMYGVAAILVGTSRQGQRLVIQATTSGVNVVLATLVLLLASPSLPDLPQLGFAVFLVVVLAAEAGPVQLAVLGAAAAALAGLGEVWLTSRADASAPMLITWESLLIGGGLLVYMNWAVAQVRLRAKVVQFEAAAEASRRLGLATDATSVAEAVLEAARTAYPMADFGRLMLPLPGREQLQAIPVALTGVGVARTDDAPLRMAPGEGLAGQVFQVGEPRFVGSPVEVRQVMASMRPEVRRQVADTMAHARSLVAVPLHSPDHGTVGVMILGCTTREHVWAEDDLPVVQSLADQAALGLERARLYDESRSQALTDPMTGLANLRQLEAVMSQELARAHRYSGRLAVLFCDMDNFKQINDSLGHAVGDAVLRLFADTVRRVMRAEDTAARYGGDEFVCVLPGADWTRAQLVADRIATMMNESLHLDHRLDGVKTAASIGAAVYPEDGVESAELLAAADEDLLRVKAKGRIPVRVLERPPATQVPREGGAVTEA